MTRYRVTLATNQLDNEPVPTRLAEASADIGQFAADLLGEDVSFTFETGVRTVGSRRLGLARPAPETEEEQSEDSE